MVFSKKIRRVSSGIVWPAIVVLVAVGIVVGAGTWSFATKKVASVAAHVVELEVKGETGAEEGEAYPNQVIATLGDVIKFVNTTEYKVTVKPPDGLFVKPDGTPITNSEGVEISAADGPNKPGVMLVSVAKDPGNNPQKIEYEVIWHLPSKQITSQPRIIVNPPD